VVVDAPMVRNPSRVQPLGGFSASSVNSVVAPAVSEIASRKIPAGRDSSSPWVPTSVT
jgi:hypothetical protein